MTRCPRIRALIWTLASISLVLFAGASCASGAASRYARDSGAAPDSLTATWHAVDTKAHTLHVITAVGLALREVRLKVDQGCQITRVGELAKLQDLKPGEVLGILYRKAAVRDVGENIDVLQARAE